MNRVRTALVLLLFTASASHGQSKSGNQVADSAREYTALEAEFQAAQQAYQKALQEAKEKRPNQEKFAARFLALAEKNPKGEAAVDALLWVIHHTPASWTGGNDASKDSLHSRALNALLRDHTDSAQLAGLCEQLALLTHKSSETFLRAVLQKNPHREVQGQACLSLAQLLQRRAAIARRLKEQPESAQQYRAMLGNEYLQELSTQDPKRLEAEIEQLYGRCAKDFGDLNRGGRGTLADIARRELFEIRNLAVGKTAPEIQGEDLDGILFNLGDYRGKVVLLDFWGHWSNACQAVQRQERLLVDRLEGKPFVLVGVNSDTDREETKKRNEKEKITWRSFWDGGSRQGPISSTWNIQNWPTFYILDVKGVIRHKYAAPPGEDVLTKDIEALIREAELIGGKKASP
jgi:peroxiredoxin